MRKFSNIFGDNPRYKRMQKPLEAAEVCDTARTLSMGRYDIISFKAGLLTVTCSSSAEAANLHCESQNIIDKINQKLGRNIVEKLRFKAS